MDFEEALEKIDRIEILLLMEEMRTILDNGPANYQLPENFDSWSEFIRNELLSFIEEEKALIKKKKRTLKILYFIFMIATVVIVAPMSFFWCTIGLLAQFAWFVIMNKGIKE